MDLDYTGERMVPGKVDPETFWEHVYRYRFARPYVRGRRVLDIACGEGYGSKGMLMAGARSVIGVDVSVDAVAHAKATYGVDARMGNAENIPVDDGSVDVVVSFETIEHLPNPLRFIDKCARVLSRQGVLVISTPNSDVYGRGGNEFHCSEMTELEFTTALRRRFLAIALYSQSVTWAKSGTVRSWASSNSSKSGSYCMVKRILGRNCEWERTIARATAHELIQKRNTLAHQLFCPWSIRRRLPQSDERPKYFVAVCRGCQRHISGVPSGGD
jgi:2-polyprenyl-3-methyl-5-hydroxy-6-metoxy-1,4-benzoquinol methylase